MANNNIDDKWLIVYQGTLDNYKRDSNKDSYKNKLVLVTGDKTATGERDQTSYLCVDNDAHSVNIPIPAIYLRGIGIGKNTYGFPDSILKFASANGINVSFSGGAVTIGIDNDILTKIDSIDNKLGKTDTIPAENVVNLSYGAKGLASTNPIIANRIPYLKADAFAFLQPEDFTVEVKYNDEVDWVALDNNNADMRGMFAQLSFGTGFPIDGSNTNWQVGSKIRITLSPKAVRNAKVDFVAVNVWANGRTFDILTEYYNSSSGMEGWYSVGDSITISSNGIAFAKYNQYFSYEEYNRKGARFTFTITTNTQFWSRIVGLSGFGSQSAEIIPTSSTAPYTLGTLWYWDYLKNVYFPNDIYEGGTPLKNKYASITSAIQGIESANDDYITISTKGGTDGTTKVIGVKTASINGSENGLATAQDVRAYTKPLKYTVNGTSSTYNGSSEATIPAIYAPNGVGKQGQLLQSMGGGAPQWTNLSAIKEAIGFAKDLTGVLEATPEEFTYRPSAGNKSIRDEGAVIRRIKGNTVVVAQPSGNAEVQRMKVTAIETVGFNQWDEQWEVGRFDTVTGVNRESNNIRCKNLIKVLPNTVYSLSVGNSRSGILAMFYDNNGNILTPIIYSDDSWTVDNLLRISSNIRNNAFITPEGTSWMKFYLETNYGSTYTNDVCISLFHTGIRRGEYEPYKEHILNLPEIAEYFHDGMNGIGDVYDEINSENAIQRIGVVDIGTLEWYTGSQKHMFLAPIENAKPTVWNEVPNAIMLPYTAVSRIESDTPDMSFCVNNIHHVSNRLCLTNFNYEDAASFKAAMSGVYLYYELAEPVVKPILEPIQLVYDVEDFGTERAISPEYSAPFRADIVYQFNAEGRIRDNGRNIEKLENKIRSYHDDGAMVTIDREIITTKSIIGNSEFRYALPDAPQDVKDDADATLATEFWVQQNIPTEIATATQKNTLTDPPRLNAYSANIVYEFLVSKTELTIDALTYLNEGYDNVWIIRFGCEEGLQLTIKPTVYWKDGIAPTFGVWGICELKFHKNSLGYLGEWKIYR